MSPDAAAALTRFALLEGFFQRRDEAGKSYCADCLVFQLRQRGSPVFSLGSVRAAVEDAFKVPGSLRVQPGEPCAACTKRRRCIGATPPGSSAPP